MSENTTNGNRWIHFIGVVLFGALMGAGAGVSILVIMARYEQDAPAVPERTVARRAEIGPAPANREPIPAGETPGMLYAAALQAGDWPAVIEQTLWMQDRLERVSLREGSGDPVVRARAELEAELGTRRPVENQLTEEGVEDKYVFAPGAQIELAGSDEGQSGLETATARRDWIKVTYPERAVALRDEENMPIRSLVVGVNTSAAGKVLKANVVGNLEIDEESLRYDWQSELE